MSEKISKTTSEKRKRTVVSITPKNHEKLRKVADKKGMKVAALADNLVSDGLEKMKEDEALK